MRKNYFSKVVTNEVIAHVGSDSIKDIEKFFIEEDEYAFCLTRINTDKNNTYIFYATSPDDFEDRCVEIYFNTDGKVTYISNIEIK